MILSPEEIAATHAYDRPGARLVGFEEVAIPYFLLTIDAVVQRRKRLGVLEEFTLSAIDAGMRDSSSVAEFLGLEQQMVDDIIWAHWQEDRIDLLPGEGGRRRLGITEIGAKTLRELVASEPERTELPVPFDRLTWRCVSLSRGDLVRDSALSTDVRQMLPRVRRRPRGAEIPVDAVSETIRSRVEGERSAEVLAIKDVVRAERWWRDAVLLVYESTTDGSHDISVAVDARPSREHELALAQQGGLESLGISIATPIDREEPEADPEIAQVLEANEERAAALMEQMGVAKRSATSESKRRSYSGEDAPVSETETESIQELQLLRQKLESLTVRRVEVFEHRELLDEALVSAKRRLLIISPWIRAAVVNRAFVRKLEEVCKRNVKIHMGWGLGTDENQWESDRRAQRDIAELAGKYPNFTLCRLGNTHAKVLIWDDTWVSSSFNWLSFRGDPNKTFRQEEGILVRIPEKVEASYADYAKQIEDGCT